MKKRVWIIGGIVAALVGTGAIASKYYGHSLEDRTHFATYMITKKLDLNDPQEANLDKLAASWIENATEMKTFRKSMFEELKTLADGEDITVGQLDGLREKIKSQFDAAADKMTPDFVAFYNSLDGEQRKIVAARLAEGPKHRGHHGRHHGKQYGEGYEKHRGEGYGKGMKKNSE